MSRKGSKEILVWAGALLTIALFLLFQVRVHQEVPGGLGRMIEAFSLVFEFAAVLKISALGG